MAGRAQGDLRGQAAQVARRCAATPVRPPPRLHDMGLLRAVTKLAATAARRPAPQDHYDMAEFVCRMHNPLGEYFFWANVSTCFMVTFGPMLHSNYYFTGRFLPKDQGNTQLCDDSW